MVTTLNHGAVFDVLGVCFGIESDRQQVIEPFVRLLECFRVDAGAPHDRVMRLVVDAGAGESVLECDDERYSVQGGEQGLLAHAHSLFLHWVFSQIEGYFLLHGSAVSHGGLGLILSGQSGTGKTTLGCALAERSGWDLFSDDVAPLSLEDGLLYPFPKALSLRPGIARPEQLAAGIDLPVLEGRAKRVIAPEALGLSVGTKALPLAALVFLEPESAPLHPDTAELSVVIHRHVPGLLAKVRKLPGVRRAYERRGKRFVQLEIQTSVPARCLSSVSELCREAGALVIGTAREAQRAEPDFDAQPRLDALALDDAVRLFLRSLWGTAQFRLIAQLGGGAALYGRVAGLLDGVQCRRLRPGRYDETLELLDQLELGG